MLTRRQAIGAAGGVIASLLVPTWLRQTRPHTINLKAFCEPEYCYYPLRKWDLLAPFTQEDRDGRLFRFASDRAICVRVDANDTDKVGEEARTPNACNLPWDSPIAVNWKPWRAIAGSNPKGLCWKCFGDKIDMQTVTDHKPCNGEGCFECDYGGRDGKPCGVCNGTGKSKEHSRIALTSEVEVGRAYFEMVKAELPSTEFARCPVNRDLVLLRFDGGAGILMRLVSNQ